MQLFSSYSCFRVCVELRSVCSACVMWRKWVIKSHDVHMITMCMYVCVCVGSVRGEFLQSYGSRLLVVADFFKGM